MTHSIEIDDIDRQIIKMLQADGRVPFLTIANELGLAEGTIRRRVAHARGKDLRDCRSNQSPESGDAHSGNCWFEC